MFASSVRRSLGGLIPPKIATPSAVVRIIFQSTFSVLGELFPHAIAFAAIVFPETGYI